MVKKEFLRFSDALLLGLFITGAQEQDDVDANSSVIKPIPRTNIYFEFANSVPDRFGIAEVAHFESFDSYVYSGGCLLII